MSDIATANETFDLSGQVALVTGASSGLGHRFAQVLAAGGAKVVLAARSVDKLEQLKSRLKRRRRGGRRLRSMSPTGPRSRRFDAAEKHSAP